MSYPSSHKKKNHYTRHAGTGFHKVGPEPDVDDEALEEGETESSLARTIKKAEHAVLEEGFGGVAQMFFTPIGRKIMNGSFLLAMMAALGVSIPELNTHAAFPIYFSSDSSATNEGSFQIEYLTVAIAALGILFYGHNFLNRGDRYERSVKRGFYYWRWFFFGWASAGMLMQLYIMECYLDLGGLLAFMVVVLSMAIQMGTQEHSNDVYHAYAIQTSANNPATTVATRIRRHRWQYFIHSLWPLLCVIGLVFSQGIYYGIKGSGQMPGVLKALIAINLVFLITSSFLSAAHNFGYGIFDSHSIYEFFFLWNTFAWIVVDFIMVYWILSNNILSYCYATTLNTVNT